MITTIRFNIKLIVNKPIKQIHLYKQKPELGLDFSNKEILF